MGALVGLVLALILGILAADAGAVSLRGARWVAAAALVVGLVARRALLRGLCALALAGAAGAGVLGVHLEDARRARPDGVMSARIEGRVAAVVRSGARVRADLTGVRRVDGGGAVSRRVRVLAARGSSGSAPGIAAALPGDEVRLDVRLRPPWGLSDPGRSARPERALERRGIGALAMPVHAARVARRVDRRRLARLRRALERLRRRVALRLEEAGPGGPLLAALAVGERGGLAPERRAAFRRLGVSHLLAVSGLHLGLVAALVFTAVRSAGTWLVPARRLPADPRRGALLCACAGAALYAGCSGWGVPVRRGLVLLLAFALGILARRPVRALAPLVLAAGAILAWDPAALFEAGAWLSFAATAALVLGLRGGVPVAGGRALLASSALALAATAPIAARSLGAVSPVALPVNAIAVPWTAAVLLPAALVSAAAAGLEPLLGTPAAALLGASERVAAASLWALEWAVARGAPDASRAPPALAAWGLAVALAGVAVLSRRLVAQVACASGVVAVLWLAPPTEIAPAPPRAVLLDVGHGDAVLVQSTRAAVLVDAARALPDGADLGRSVVAPALRALGVARLDLLVVTHADLDHRGGVPAVLQALPVARVWLPTPAHAGEREAFEPIRRAAARSGAPVFEVDAAHGPLALPGLRITPLWPLPGAGANSNALSRNDRSLVVRVDLPAARVLLPGDLEVPGEDALLAAAAPTSLRGALLKLGHHGSRTSSGRAWLDAVRPRIAVASAPLRGRFALPHDEVRRRVAEAGAWLGWTGRDGALLVGLGRDRRVRSWRRGWIPSAATGWAVPRRSD